MAWCVKLHNSNWTCFDPTGSVAGRRMAFSELSSCRSPACPWASRILLTLRPGLRFHYHNLLLLHLHTNHHRSLRFHVRTHSASINLQILPLN